MATQIAAGVSASFCYFGLFSKSFVLAPAAGFGALQAGLCEVLYTFMLVFVVLNVAIATKSGNSPNRYYGLAIGFVIVAGAYGAGAVSGGCFNPAVAIGIDASGAMTGSFGWCLVYTLCEFVGAALAAVCFKLVRPQEFGGEKGPATDLISEFLGTYFLVLTVGLNVLGKSAAGAFSIAASLMCMIYALGNVSGAHFNPAVTVAIFCSGRCKDKLTPVEAVKFIVVQVLGGITAAFTYRLIRNGDSFALSPGAKFGWGEVAVAEAVFTFVLCYVVLCVAVSGTTKTDAMFGLAIGACVTVGGNAIGAISGGSLNPAVSWGIASSHMAGSSLIAAAAYTCFELLGAVAAAGVFAVTHAVDVKELDDEAKHIA